MKGSGLFLILFLVLLMVSLSPASQKRHRSMTGSAAKGAESAGMQVAPNLDQRLAKWREVRMPFRSAGLKPQEVRMVEMLVDACRHLEEIYWRQSDPQGLALYQALQGSTNPQDIKVRRLLRINGSRFDLLDDNKPFLGTAPMPPGHGLYPQDLTREKIEQYVKDHPREEIRNLQSDNGCALARRSAGGFALSHRLSFVPRSSRPGFARSG
jgi:hypothetical protein